MTKILIVDDDIGATTLIEKIMLSESYIPTSVNESYRAMEVANELSPDLIILDLMMPEPTGFQLCRMFRATQKFAKTPIVIVTALNDRDSEIVAFGAGANEYVTKPINIPELKVIIKALLDED